MLRLRHTTRRCCWWETSVSGIDDSQSDSRVCLIWLSIDCVFDLRLYLSSNLTHPVFKNRAVHIDSQKILINEQSTHTEQLMSGSHMNI